MNTIKKAASSISASTGSVGENMVALRDEVNALIGEFKDATQDKLPEFRNRLKLIAGSVENSGSQLLEQASASGRQFRDRTRSELKHFSGATENYIAEHPWKTVTVVAAATLLASLLFSRKD